MKQISETGLQVLKRRYLKKDENGVVIENPADMFRRVANTIAAAEEKYISDAVADPSSVICHYRNVFYDMMSNLDFLPNSPTLMNAGRPLGQLSACFVLPIEDTMDGIFSTLKNAALIHKSGGGTGFSFSRLRPAGARVSTTNGQASGPLSFMDAFNAATGTVAQGGCFAGDTRVMTKGGVVPIKELTAGTLVLTKNFDGSVSWTPCTAPFLTKRQVSVVKVWTSNDCITCTPDHPFMIGIKATTNINATRRDTSTEYIYKKAIELQPGDKVLAALYMCDGRDNVNSNGKLPVEIRNWDDEYTYTEISKVESCSEFQDVWNVEVPGTHNYAVCTEYDSKPLCAQYIYRCIFVSNTRRGANMGLLRVDHPDILEFIKVKEDLTKLTNFNLSVGITDAFVNALGRGIMDDEYELIDPNTGTCTGYMSAHVVWDTIVHSAWKCGEPGIVFLDRVNENNFLKPLYGDVEATNPCLVGSTPITIRLFDGTIAERAIETLVGRDIDVWNGYEWSTVTPMVTGENQPVMTIAFSNGRWIRCTPAHKFLMATGARITAMELKVGDVLAPWKMPDHENEPVGESVYVDAIIPSNGSTADKVYCLTEPKRHAFMANGVVVGNCGEQPLLPYEACNLGSINLANFVYNESAPKHSRSVDFSRLAYITKLAVRFLDNVIDVNKYPLPEINTMCKATRKIGLGVMGFADLLHKLGIPYNSEEGVKLGESIMHAINEAAHSASEELARERGPYPDYRRLQDIGVNDAPYRRNAMVTTIAPTGSISAIAGVSSGIEPLFANVFYKNVMDNDYLPVVNMELMSDLKAEGVLTPELEEKIKASGTIAHIEEIPEHIRRVYVCAHDITPMAHIQMQAAFQKNVDNAISKTINFNEDATKEDIELAYRLAYRMKCKGVTVYRNNCRQNQVLNIGTVENKDKPKKEHATKESVVEAMIDALFNAADPEEYAKLNGHDIFKIAEGILNRLRPKGNDYRYRGLYTQLVFSIISDITTNEHKDMDWLADSHPSSCIELGKALVERFPITIAGRQVPPEPEQVTPAELIDDIRTTKPRPEVTAGYTKCVKINCGKLYVTVNHDEHDELFEVFTTNGKGGGCPAQSEAVCRLASLLLRAGVPVKDITRQLRGIKCTACLRNPDIHVLSCPDAIGRELEAEALKLCKCEIDASSLKGRSKIDTTITIPAGPKLNMPVPPEVKAVLEMESGGDINVPCPQCGAPMHHEGGCVSCMKCGYSNCG